MLNCCQSRSVNDTHAVLQEISDVEFPDYYQLSSEDHNNTCQSNFFFDKIVEGKHKESPMFP